MIDLSGLITSIQPNKSANLDAPDFHRHLDAALDWIEIAHKATSDGGISKGYDLLRGQWAPSYPETTGYTIPTLLNAAKVLEKPDWRSLALHLADYLLVRAGSQGGVFHWQEGSDAQPVVFDTGQVLFGWLAAFQASGDERYLEAARHAGNWLVSNQDESGAWLTYQYLSYAKVIDTRVSWALACLGAQTGEVSYTQAAQRNLRWALTHQMPDGWFERCGFKPSQSPYTHTLAYTAEGLLECGLLLGVKEWIQAAQRTADALRDCQRPNGGLASAFTSGWKPAIHSSCLTGNCQTARLWLLFFTLTGNSAYRDAARRALEFTASTQRLVSSHIQTRGGIAGSAPLWGRYERLKYPNWAAKFFVDALLEYHRVRNVTPPMTYAG